MPYALCTMHYAPNTIFPNYVLRTNTTIPTDLLYTHTHIHTGGTVYFGKEGNAYSHSANSSATSMPPVSAPGPAVSAVSAVVSVSAVNGKTPFDFDTGNGSASDEVDDLMDFLEDDSNFMS
jgi:hypothetical protein